MTDEMTAIKALGDALGFDMEIKPIYVCRPLRENEHGVLGGRLGVKYKLIDGKMHEQILLRNEIKFTPKHVSTKSKLDALDEIIAIYEDECITNAGKYEAVACVLGRLK